MIQRLFLSVVLTWALFASGMMSCGSSGPGESEITNTEESGSDTTTPTGGTDGTIEPGTTGIGGTGGESTTTTGGGSGTTTAATTGTGGGTSTGGATATGGSGSGGTISLTAGISICVTHPEICFGQAVPAGPGPSPIGGYSPVGPIGGGVGDMPAPDATIRANPGLEAIKQFGTVTTPIVNEELTQGGVFTAPNGFIMKDGITKEFAKGTVITVNKEGVATATTPDGTVETLPSDATIYFTGGAAVTRTGASAFTLQPGHAVRFGAGNFEVFQSAPAGTFRAPAVEQNLGR